MYFIVCVLLLLSNISNGQVIKLSCSEKYKKNDTGKDSIIIKTCLIKNFKFVSTAYPDNMGRYLYYEHEVYFKTNKKFIKCPNSKVFNKNQQQLLSIINTRIQKDFKKISTNPDTKDCFSNLDSIPKYKMNDLEISFDHDEIWFEVHWGLISACRAVDGTIITFKLIEIQKYFN